MTEITTVTGKLSADEMGRTLPHEHVAYGVPGWRIDKSVAPYDRDECRRRAVETLSRLREEFGLDTLFDATMNDAGRDARLLRDVAEESGVSIVCSTGTYPESRGSTTYFDQHRRLLGDVTDELEELFVTELRDGIRDTGVRAGIVKVGSSNGEITDYDDALLRAAARTQRRTGAPILTHTESGTMGVEQAETLLDAGANPDRTVIGHIDQHDPEVQRELVEMGVRIGFDQIGTNGDETDDDTRIERVASLCRDGYADRILLSHDYIVNWLGRSVEVIYDDLDQWRPDRLFEYVVPELETALSPDDVTTMTETNPKRLFTA
ncbi:phosphotriesterase family protein [Halorussus caseinilyticus]|uniref:Phosphotriesterase n=1 Tax=Halorussus caseinilyticus TaxID=3034025 RepID=A0ABD5WFJ6_9EURY|nr:hypothetical protein [Halorussus sp. DT72]